MSESARLIDEYLSLILSKNKEVNLTRIVSPEQARILHIEDSLSALQDLNQSPAGLYGDLGSGGGFPGVPLSIASGRKTLLVDSVQKKMKAVEEILTHMELNEQISVYAGRIEDLALEKKKSFAVLTARALTQLPSLLELACPLLMKSGRLICYKAQITDEEISRARSLENKLGMRLLYRSDFYLSDGETYRELIVFEKVSNPKVNLPRRVGLAQHSPLA